MKKDLLKFSNIMIENIFKLTKQSISKINELKIGFRKILDEVVSFSIIDKDNYKQIENMPTTHQFFKNHENVIECLKKTFEFNIFTPIEINNDSNSNDLFFSKISESRGLWSINLTTFKLSYLEYTKKLPFDMQGCKIGKNQLFLTGGKISENEFVGDTLIIDTKLEKIESLHKGIPRLAGGSICKKTVFTSLEGETEPKS